MLTDKNANIDALLGAANKQVQTILDKELVELTSVGARASRAPTEPSSPNHFPSAAGCAGDVRKADSR